MMLLEYAATIFGQHDNISASVFCAQFLFVVEPSE